MRLIDADALGMDMWIQMGIVYGEDIGKAFADIVRNAPTIDAKTKCVARIEVDTEEIVRCIKEEYDIMDRWIPCSERLPNEDEKEDEFKWYLVTVKGHGLFVDVAPFEDKLWKGLSSSQEVIAWMPLPKPYREDSEV